MGKSDGIIKVFDGSSCMVRYFETVGIPKSASIEISVDDIRVQLTYSTLLPLLRKRDPTLKMLKWFRSIKGEQPPVQDPRHSSAFSVESLS